MNDTEPMPTKPLFEAPKKKGPKVIATFFVLGLIVVLVSYLWINWEKPRRTPDPLSPELTALIQNMPGTSDAMFYVGLKDIRNSRFWQKAVPDSLKETPFLSMGKRVDSLLAISNINLNRDLDTLLISFQRSGSKQQKFIGMASGDLARKFPAVKLRSASFKSADVAGRKAYKLDSALWVAPMSAQRIAIGSSSEMLEKFFTPSGRLLARDTATASLIEKTRYKSHIWFTLPSPRWTAGALQSITSKNSEVKSVGNLNRIQQISMSAKFDDGLQAQSEWVYNDRQAAFFASTFLWGTIKLSTLGPRTSNAAKELLNHMKIQQNLESIIITADLPLSAFKKAAQEK